MPNSLAGLAADVRSGRRTALSLAREALEAIAARDPAINAVTRILTDRALEEAAAVDAMVTAGQDPGPLAGVPYGVKDLFDVAGLSTTAGAGRHENKSPAKQDAEAIARLRAAGAVLVATLNMDEFAYGFVTDNARWGITRNPHDLHRFAGGSSGGSAAAVAAGMVAFALGSDTNGSIRIPASLCGIHGIKPTHSSLPMAGTFPLAHSLDDVGAFARTAADLALVDRTLRATDKPADHVSASRSVAMLGGWFRDNLAPEMMRALEVLSRGLGEPPVVQLPDVARARSAAFLITAFEGGRLHRQALCADPMSYDPATRDRLIAGNTIPDAIYREALDYRSVFAGYMDVILSRYDILIAPTVFGPAPLIDEPVILIDRRPQPARSNLGLYTQPISFLGLPVVAAPLAVEGLPLGIQLIGAAGQDAALLSFAAELEAKGLTASRLAC